ncbi:hypothetical protein GCM10010464_02310 [Pseudonocardia yunnanensis]|uniref:TetR family transcriptional regulator n=1 Tax=Pseudonocardia yunnanensis TaxID=58107 RepID=A0ABW4EVX5_9PSEU
MTDGRTTRSGPESRTPRTRDAAATRSAIFTAARRLFTRLGYDGAGMREIAQEAGVDARLIGRYFGSKELLFAEVVEAAHQKTLLMAPGVNHEAAIALLARSKDSELDGMLLTIRSASNERAVAIIRSNLEGNYQRKLTSALDGPDADGRAALLVAICTGVQFMRNVIGSTALADGDHPELVDYLEAALDAVAVARPRTSRAPASDRSSPNTPVPENAVAAGERDLRSAVIDATAQLLALEGPSGLTIHRVASEAGCSTMVVNHYFQGTQGLLDAVHVEGFERLTAAQRIARTGDPEADLMRMCHIYREVALAHPAYYQVMFGRPAPDHRPSEDSRSYERRFHDQFVEAVRRWGGDRPLTVDVPAAAHMLWATGHGLVMLELTGNAPPGDPRAAYDSAIAVTLHGLRA